MYNTLNKISGIYPDSMEMDMYLTSLGFTQDTVKYLQNPCSRHNPHLMYDVDKAVDILYKGIKQGDSICIIGDYDADGICSTTELFLTLRALNADVDYIIPHRINDGYGMSVTLVDKALENQAKIILTCDNGIAAFEAVDYAKSKGLTVIITDHHEIQETLPNADAIVHPGLGSYPFRNISGAQVAYKLCECLLENKVQVLGKRLMTAKMKQEAKELDEYLLQLSTITIVSDVMPIAQAEGMGFNENRKWLLDGLHMIQTNPNWRIEMLLDALKINKDVVEETTIGFYIAPILNSSGRLNEATDAVDFLTAWNKDEALKAMSFLLYLNEKRKEIKAECMSRITFDEKDNCHIIALEGIHEGVIGILAGQIANTTHKPTFVFTDCEVEGEKAWKGSARGNSAVNLFEILSKTQQETSTIYAFGGHAGAAGITVLDRDFKGFKDALMKEMDSIDMDVQVDVVNIYNVEQRERLINAVKDLKPFGNGMPLPKMKETRNINSVALYYKKGHVKYSFWEKNHKGEWVGAEYWSYGTLEKVKADNSIMDNVYLAESNAQALSMQMSKEDAEANKMETYKRKKAVALRRTFIVEMGYSAFMNKLGPNPSLIDIF